jgi:uncharacterized protein (DUF2141 family)
MYFIGGLLIEDNSILTFVDIDNDSDMDVFIGEKNGTIYYYKNTGSLTSPAFTLQTSSSNPLDGIDIGLYATPAFVDIDSDGDMDAFIGEGSGTIYYYKNTGSATTPLFTIQTSSSNPFDGVDVILYSSPSFVDIDNDGDMDAFIGDYYGNISFYKNTGSAVLAVFTDQYLSPNPFGEKKVYGNNLVSFFVDIDNDGDMDVFIGNLNGSILYFKNTGSATSPVFTIQTSSSNPFDGVDIGSNSAPFFVDIDNDGDMDVFIGDKNGIIYYYKNTGSATTAVFVLQTSSSNPFDGVDVGTYSSPSFVDIDNDGDMDAFIGEFSGTIYYYKNTGSITSPSFTLQTSSSNPFDGIDIGIYSTPTFVDIDNDGDMDTFIGEFLGTLNYYKNTGNSTIPIFTLQTLSPNPFDGLDLGTNSSPSFVDIDNDGDMDAFIGEFYGSIYYYKNMGSAISSVFTSQTSSSNPFDGIDVGVSATPCFIDIDNDDDMDAFIGESGGTIYYYKNTGGSTSPAFTIQTSSSNPFDGVDVGGSSAPGFADIDNDGDIDAFIGEKYGEIYYYKNEGNATTPVFVLQNSTSNPFDGIDVGDNSAPSFVDIENDGDMDVFIGEYSGGVYYYKNTGNATAAVFMLQTSSANPFDGVDVGAYATPTFVDIDNDGDMDAFIGGNVGTNSCFSNMCVTNTVTSMPAFEKENNIFLKVYPNPAQNIITIELLENAPLQSIEIYNLVGRLIYSNNNIEAKQQISVDKLSNGVYLLEVRTANEIYTTKVCITH